MNWIAALLLLLTFVLLVTGSAMLAPAAGVLTAGVLTGVAGVLSLTAGKPKDRKVEQ